MQTTHQRRANTAAIYPHLIRSRTNAAVALTYARDGIPVFPCDARKRPLTPHGHHGATVHLDAVRRWWTRWPDALVSIPTGPDSGVWVLDVDGEAGRCSVNALMAGLGVKTISDFTPCVSRTPSGGLHLIFRLRQGERPRSRARDIGAGLDTRGVKADGTSAGYIVAPGTALPDGRQYELVDAITLEPIETPALPFEAAAPAPRKLVELATFNATERALIAASPGLWKAIRDSEPTAWPAIIEQCRIARRGRLLNLPGSQRSDPAYDPENTRQRSYVNSILKSELSAIAAMQPGSGRNHAAFRLACRVGRWVHHGVIARPDFERAVLSACESNGLLREDGRNGVLGTIASGLARSAHDALPVLEARA